MAMSIEVSFAFGMRAKWSNWRVESTIAILTSENSQVSDSDAPGPFLAHSNMEGEEQIPTPIALAFRCDAADAVSAA